MSASNFLAGIREGRAIIQSNIDTSLKKKRFDMLKMQFELDSSLKRREMGNFNTAQKALDGFYRDVAPITRLTDPEQYGKFTAAQIKYFPDIALDKNAVSAYEKAVTQLNDRALGEQANTERAEFGALGTKFRKYYPLGDPPMIELPGGVQKVDIDKMTEMVDVAKEKDEQKSQLREVNYTLEQEWAKAFPGEPFPTIELEPTPGEPAPDTPIKDNAAARRLLRDETARLTEEEAFAVAETKDKIVYRGDFNKWKKLLKNPALDAKKPDDQKQFRTYQHDEQISGLMAAAGLEAFKLSDELIPDPVSGGYENMAKVTGMINDMIRKQDEEAGLRKEAVKKPLTESQAKDYMFSGRMMATESTLAKLEAVGFAPESIANNVGMNWLPEFGKTNAQKRYIAARANWVAALLRRESGAAIAESEYEGGFTQYFPLINDSPTVIADKRNLRRQVQRDMRAIATNQADLSGYEAVGESVTYNSEADVQAAVSRGRLKGGDTYRYKTQLGKIQNGVVQSPSDAVVQPPSDAGVQPSDPHLPPTWPPAP